MVIAGECAQRLVVLLLLLAAEEERGGDSTDAIRIAAEPFPRCFVESELVNQL
jgi:hypothetical protein